MGVFRFCQAWSNFTGSAGLVLVGVGERVDVTFPIGLSGLWELSPDRMRGIFSKAGGVGSPACARRGGGGLPVRVPARFQ